MRKQWLAIAALGLAGLESPSSIAATLAHWTFDEVSNNAVDVSGNHHDASLENGAAPVQAGPPGACRTNLALALDGTDDHAFVPDSPSLRPKDALTLEAWIYATTPPPSDLSRVIVGKQVGGATLNSYQLLLNADIHAPAGCQPNGCPLFVFTQSTAHGPVERRAEGTTPLSPNAWHHVAGTWDGATMKLYVDGQSVALLHESDAVVNRTEGPIAYDASPVLIGADNDGSLCCHFNGLIDDVRISDKALSRSEFLEPTCPAPGGGCCVVPTTISTRAVIKIEALHGPVRRGGASTISEVCRPACEEGTQFLVQSVYASGIKRNVVANGNSATAPDVYPSPVTVPWAVSVPMRQEVSGAPAIKVSLTAMSHGLEQAFASLPAGQRVDETTSGRIPVTINLLNDARNGDIFEFDIHLTGACGRPTVCPP
jgi:hypothetical protein